MLNVLLNSQSKLVYFSLADLKSDKRKAIAELGNFRKFVTFSFGTKTVQYFMKKDENELRDY